VRHQFEHTRSQILVEGDRDPADRDKPFTRVGLDERTSADVGSRDEPNRIVAERNAGIDTALGSRLRIRVFGVDGGVVHLGA
jgi:hypothetical protein